MKINRAALIAHLEKIHCGGQIPGAVFSGALSAAALTEDHNLIVIAPGLEKVENLAEPTGVPDIPLLISSLGALSGAGNDATVVDLSVEDHRLVINEEHRGTLRLMTANPSTIGTKIAEASLKGLLEKAPKEQRVPLSRSLIDGIRKTFSLLKAQEVELIIGKKKGEGMIRIGNENAHIADFPVAEFKTGRGEDPYKLLFAKHLINVFGVITNFSEAVLCLGGPAHMITIEDGPYKYILSPRTKPAE